MTSVWGMDKHNEQMRLAREFVSTHGTLVGSNVGMTAIYQNFKAWHALQGATYPPLKRFRFRVVVRAGAAKVNDTLGFSL